MASVYQHYQAVKGISPTVDEKKQQQEEKKKKKTAAAAAAAQAKKGGDGAAAASSSSSSSSSGGNSSNSRRRQKQREKAVAKAKAAEAAASGEKQTFSADKDKDFADWYEQVLRFAEIVDKRYPVKGMPVLRPAGFYMHNKIMNLLEAEWEKQDIMKAQFPLLIPRSFLEIEKDHVKGFAEEVFWVTRGGSHPFEDGQEYALRPTSETAMYHMFHIWVQSFRDLPLKVHQTCNVFRYETKQTRPLIRAREIHWNEAHTCHETAAEALENLENAYSAYLYLIQDCCCFTGQRLRRPVWDQFPGGEHSDVMDTVMPCGRVLQTIGAHYLGQKFAKVFDIKFRDQSNQYEHAYMTCYGVSTRLLAACLSTHGDNSGLVNPPRIAQYQVLLLPVVQKRSDRSTVDKAHEYAAVLRAAGVRVVVDDSTKSPGDKFFHWELRGVPLRVEVGPRDLKAQQVVLVPRDTKKKESAPAATSEQLVQAVQDALAALEERLRTKAFEHHRTHLSTCTSGSLEEVKQLLYERGGFVRVPFHSMGKDGEEADKLIHEATGGEVRGYVPGEEAPPAGTLCIATGLPAKHWGYVARAY
eukprot:CAMPEP_0177634200 /NCGR_PEP_ID=MMETSP0447-20121125/3242_1 /TAXON_ID=0 /ORGANISM="Stygamoeba regulata, Strain BSH-02190019" /LENGTH=582 /DNA_ID=CAMNT_0019135907 /DNA_START=135 /DNA_END=1883 /DNA_ORIENTATION=-